jgi:hypothetical protein
LEREGRRWREAEAIESSMQCNYAQPLNWYTKC